MANTHNNIHTLLQEETIDTPGPEDKYNEIVKNSVDEEASNPSPENILKARLLILEEQIQKLTEDNLAVKQDLIDMTQKYWQEKDQDLILTMAAETERDRALQDRDNLTEERDKIAEERDTLKIDMNIFRTGYQAMEKERAQYFVRLRGAQEDRDVYQHKADKYKKAYIDMEQQRNQFRRLSQEVARELEDAKRHCGEELFERPPPYPLTQQQLDRDDVPPFFICPITQCVIQDPLVDREGNTFERNAIITSLRHKLTSPITRTTLYPSTGYLSPNRTLQLSISRWFEEH